jgi:GNAT superfamily N-acetyltransferase
VGKVMSHCVAKHARRSKRSIVLNSCHYDVIEWLDPDWIIDCNKQTYTDRRNRVGVEERTDRLRFDVYQADKRTWGYFSKYHYLSERLAPNSQVYGLWCGVDQIGFQAFTPYIIGNFDTYFSNRTVIHPDYAGLGLGIKLINETSKHMVKKGFKIKAKFSSTPIYKAMKRQPEWRCTGVTNPIKTQRISALYSRKTGATRENSIRSKTICYHFDFVWREESDRKTAT